uniref:Uncharacterized protein n=1 Tax=Arundo donax TaxID=35708 RepID=A0A0A8ZP62_ARUDO
MCLRRTILVPPTKVDRPSATIATAPNINNTCCKEISLDKKCAQQKIWFVYPILFPIGCMLPQSVTSNVWILKKLQ